MTPPMDKAGGPSIQKNTVLKLFKFFKMENSSSTEDNSNSHLRIFEMTNDKFQTVSSATKQFLKFSRGEE